MKATLLLTVTFLTFISSQLSAQTDKEKALKIGLAAINLMDEGQLDSSIALLGKAQKLDPERLDYPYEMANALYRKEKYNEAIKILSTLEDRRDAKETTFQLLGNCYDLVGDSVMAFKKYDKGLKKFPNSGMLHLEKGNIYWGRKDYATALKFYEEGIKADPTFPSNYYRATRIYCFSNQVVWGLIYGEIFMNLDRNSQRTTEVSKLLYDTYKERIKVESDTSVSIDFCKIIIDASKVDPKHLKMPFCSDYGEAMILAVVSAKKIDIEYLNNVRQNFVINYFKLGFNKTHPNILFDYQNKLLKAGYMDAYNHWILMAADPNASVKWKEANEEKWDNFIKWFRDNPLEVTKSNRFYSGQYD